MKLLQLRSIMLALTLCIALPQYAFAAQPSNMQQVWNKYKVAIIAAGAGVLALLGLGSGAAAYRSRTTSAHIASTEQVKDLEQAFLKKTATRVTISPEKINNTYAYSKQIAGGDTPLILAIEYNFSPEQIQSIIDLNADVNKEGQDGDTPLLVAIKKGNIPVIKILLDNDADITKANSKQPSNTPVYVAKFEPALGHTTSLTIITMLEQQAAKQGITLEE